MITLYDVMSKGCLNMLPHLMQTQKFQWIDLTSPTKEQLLELNQILGLPKKVVFNCLDPDYLPHVEVYGSTSFVVLRLPEPNTKFDADTVQELTTKIALFVRSDKVISIHRLPLEQIINIHKKVKVLEDSDISSFQLLSFFFEQVAHTFEEPLSQLERKMEHFEQSIFQSTRSKALLPEGYYIKRKASSYKKVLKFTLDIMGTLSQKNDCPFGIWQESKDKLERCLFYADDIFENTQGLLNLYLSIQSQKTNEASYKTNETMRVLTILSIFFLPLNFLAGVFGMNFTHMPILNNEYGFWISLVLMLVVTLSLLFYLMTKGWIDHRDKSVKTVKEL